MSASGTKTPFDRQQPPATGLILSSRYLTDREWSGVWVSDQPLDNSEGASGEALLQIEIVENRIAAFEWVEAGKQYREWLVPAAVLNDAGTVKLAGGESG